MFVYYCVSFNKEKPRKHKHHNQYFYKTLIVNCNYNIYGNSKFTDLAYDIRKQIKYNTFTDVFNFDDLVAFAEMHLECKYIIDKIQTDSIDHLRNVTPRHTAFHLNCY